MSDKAKTPAKASLAEGTRVRIKSCGLEAVVVGHVTEKVVGFVEYEVEGTFANGSKFLNRVAEAEVERVLSEADIAEAIAAAKEASLTEVAAAVSAGVSAGIVAKMATFTAAVTSALDEWDATPALRKKFGDKIGIYIAEVAKAALDA